MGDSDYHECDECKKFEHQILSLTGQTKGYTTIDEAKEQGLFHPNCIHWFEVTDKVLDEYEGLKGDKPKNKKEIKYDGRLENINKAFTEHYDKAKSLVKDIRNKVFKKGMKAGEYQKAALEYLRDKIPEKIKKEIFNMGFLPNEIKTLLNSKSDDLLLSIETLTKNIIKHEEININDYLKINQYLTNADVLLKEKNVNQALQIVVFKKDNEYYQIVLKSTLNKNENFIQSFHITDLENINKKLSRKNIEIIKNNFNKNMT